MEIGSTTAAARIFDLTAGPVEPTVQAGVIVGPRLSAAGGVAIAGRGPGSVENIGGNASHRK